MKSFVILLISFSASLFFLEQVYGEEVYREIDDDGVPSFSDQAMPGSEAVDIRPPVVFKDPSLQRRIVGGQESGEPEEASLISYQAVITDPVNDTAVRSNPGDLTLTFEITPALRVGHNAELLMDGKKIRNLGNGGTAELNNLDRGTHVFKIRVVDKKGKVITEGPATAVSVLRYHKPPPKPPVKPRPPKA